MHVFAPEVTVPLLGEDGKVAMESPYKVARAPGGSGERGGLEGRGDGRKGGSSDRRRGVKGGVLASSCCGSWRTRPPLRRCPLILPHPALPLTPSPLPSPLPSGEIFRGLRESGMLAHMRRAGVRCLDVHAVEDNIMAKIADPTFMGEGGGGVGQGVSVPPRVCVGGGVRSALCLLPAALASNGHDPSCLHEPSCLLYPSGYSPHLPLPLPPAGYCHSINLDCAAKVVDPDSMQDTLYGLAMAAGVLEGEGEAAEGPVMDVLPGMVPATGQFYLAMRWVDKVGGGDCPDRGEALRIKRRGAPLEKFRWRVSLTRFTSPPFRLTRTFGATPSPCTACCQPQCPRGPRAPGWAATAPT